MKELQQIIQKYMTTIKRNSLFHGISDEEITSLMGCLHARCQEYVKEQHILHIGDAVHEVGIVLDGNVHVVKDDFWGNASILTNISAGDVFAESYACSGSPISEVNVVTASKSLILWIDFSRILGTCSNSCQFHTRLIHNLITSMGNKNRMLTKKIEHMSKRTTRDKLLSYLSAESLKAGTASFTIAFNRQQLADYICVDRSAMSNELSKLRTEGILDFDKNTFTLYY